MKKGIVTVILLVLIALIVCAVWFAHSTKNEEWVNVNIESGASVRSISECLAQEGVIRHPKLFVLYVKATGEGANIQAGNHEFRKGMKYSDCIKELTSSADFGDAVKVTIPEGYEIHQIADIMEQAGICKSDAFMTAVKTHDFDYPFLKNLPDRDVPLEGYLFPDTYQFHENTNPDDCIRVMLEQFQKKLYTEENRKRAEELGYTFDEIVTMASIIEREAAGDIDRSKVASVFYNRLNSDYRYLESCATVQYILGERKTVLSYDDTRIDSPYNTYRNPGLPIGPIASPGVDCFHAALYPADTNYRYFVVGKDGQHIFSETYQEHLKAQE